MTFRFMLCALLVASSSGFSPLIPQTNPKSTLSSSSLTRVGAASRPEEGEGNLPKPSTSMQAFKALAAGGLLAASLLVSNPLPAAADGPRIVGELKGSGLVFKDTLQIESFEDPKIKGVTLYISNFQRPLTERLTSNFLADPSYASVACARTGPVSVASNIGMGKGGEEVFEESRSLLFKTLRVQRVFDAEKKTAIYVSYNTRLDKGDDSNKSRFKSSLCAVSLEDYGKPDLPTSSPALAP